MKAIDVFGFNVLYIFITYSPIEIIYIHTRVTDTNQPDCYTFPSFGWL